MVEGIVLSKNEYYTARSIVTSIIGSDGYDLEKLVQKMGYTSTPNRVYNALLSFFTCVETTYQKYKPIFGDVESLLLGTYIGALEGKKTLGVEEANVNCGFENVQLDYSSSHLELLHNLTKIYKSRMEHRTIAGHMEFTSSFLEWNLRNAVKAITQKYPTLYSQVNGMNAKIREETYALTFRIAGKKSSPSAVGDMGQSDSFYNELIMEREKLRRVKPHLYIAGHEGPKQTIRELISTIRKKEEMALRHEPTEQFSHIMVVGPPGTGKSTLIQGSAREAGDIVCRYENASNLISTYFGGSAKAIEGVFKAMYDDIKLKKANGGFLILEEIEAYSAERSGGGDKEQMTMMVSTLTTLLDAVSFIPIIVFGITNRPEIVDSAIKSRMEPLYMGYPATEKEELEIHKQVMRKYQDACISGQIFSPSFDPEVLLEFSRKDERLKSGRVIDKIYRKASIRKDLAQYGVPLSTEDMMAAFKQHYENMLLSDEEGRTNRSISTITR